VLFDLTASQLGAEEREVNTGVLSAEGNGGLSLADAGKNTGLLGSRRRGSGQVTKGKRASCLGH